MRLLADNPILRHELALVFTRRGAFLRLLAFGAVVALAVFSIWPREAKFLNMRDKVSRDALANLAGALQMLVLLFGPAYAATSVTRDREHGFLETLCSGNFSPEQIFRGKFLSATAFLWMLIGATMPMAALVYLLGGIAPGEFFAIYAELFLWSLAICAYGVRRSILSMRSAEALAQTYIRVIPIGALWVFFPQLHPVWLLLPVFVLSPVLKLDKDVGRHLRFPFDFQAQAEETEAPITENMATLGRRLFVPRRRQRPMHDWENPVVVRELSYQGLHSAGRVVGLMPMTMALGVPVALICAVLLKQPQVFHLVVLLMAAFLIPALGAAAFTSEADQRTLEPLVQSLLRRRTIVLGKVWVPMRIGLILLIVLELLYAALMAVVAPQALDLWGQSMMIIAAAIVLLSATSVLWSQLARSTPQAVIGAYATAFILLVGIPALCRHLFIYNDLALREYAWVGAASPAIPFLLLTSPWQWVAQMANAYGSPVQAWDAFFTAFLTFALVVSAVELLVLMAGVERAWMRPLRRLRRFGAGRRPSPGALGID